jgi:hypothetical protein
LFWCVGIKRAKVRKSLLKERGVQNLGEYNTITTGEIRVVVKWIDRLKKLRVKLSAATKSLSNIVKEWAGKFRDGKTHDDFLAEHSRSPSDGKNAYY